MKKLTVNFIGAEDDGYVAVTGGQQYPKWDFQKDGPAEFVLMERKTLPNKMKNGATFDLYTAIHKETKKPHAFFTGAVLEDKLKNIPMFSLVRIKFTGVHPMKKYHTYQVDLNKNFRYDPAVFNLDDYTPVKDDVQQNSSNASTGATNSRVASTQIEEDLPF